MENEKVISAAISLKNSWTCGTALMIYRLVIGQGPPETHQAASLFVNQPGRIGHRYGRPRRQFSDIPSSGLQETSYSFDPSTRGLDHVDRRFVFNAHLAIPRSFCEIGQELGELGRRIYSPGHIYGASGTSGTVHIPPPPRILIERPICSSVKFPVLGAHFGRRGHRIRNFGQSGLLENDEPPVIQRVKVTIALERDQNQKSGKCVEDPSGGTSGTQLVIFTCNANSDQQWTMLTSGPRPPARLSPPPPAGRASITVKARSPPETPSIFGPATGARTPRTGPLSRAGRLPWPHRGERDGYKTRANLSS